MSRSRVGRRLSRALTDAVADELGNVAAAALERVGVTPDQMIEALRSGEAQRRIGDAAGNAARHFVREALDGAVLFAKGDARAQLLADFVAGVAGGTARKFTAQTLTPKKKEG